MSVFGMRVSDVMHLMQDQRKATRTITPSAPRYPSASEFGERLGLHRTEERNTVLVILEYRCL